MRWTEWLPFFDAMKHIASLDVATLGPNKEVKRRSFQYFVEEIVDSAVAGGDHPLVLIDPTSAAGMWPWLNDVNIGRPVIIGPEGAHKSSA